jgi:predicted nucleic acid-binding protein
MGAAGRFQRKRIRSEEKTEVIILDTNVVSALMTEEPDPIVTSWLDGYPSESVWITAITIFELRLGIEILPASRKRREFEDQFARLVHDDLQGRVVAVDLEAAERGAELSARRRSRGKPIEIRDTLIAGIVLSRRAEFATRNVRHFADLDLPVVDPWND